MPSHPFPAQDQSQCPISVPLPTAFNDHFLALKDREGKPISLQIGCLIDKPFTDMRGWSIWSFEHAMFAIGSNDPPGKERIAALWVQADKDGRNREVKMKFRLPGNDNDWYNFHVYNTAVAISPDDPPGGEIRYDNFGDANDTNVWNFGEASFSLDKQPVSDRTWYFIASRCNPTHGFLGIRTGHKCHADILPRLSVAVDIPPKQPFSCGAHSFRGTGLVLEVGSSCSSSPYGMFVYIWSAPCTNRCPSFADEYGFVVAAPSRG
jgi:hypothetical protein